MMKNKFSVLRPPYWITGNSLRCQNMSSGSPNIFRKSHESALLNSKRFGSGSEKIGLGVILLAPGHWKVNNCSHCADIGGKSISAVRNMNAGTPQGTTSGPYEFKLLINNLKLDIQYIKNVMIRLPFLFLLIHMTSRYNMLLIV
jgi:hypothetical protein